MRRSLIASILGRYGILVLQVATSVILARQLTPAEMGVWGIGQSAIFLSSTLRDFGAGDYLVRSGDIGPTAIGRVFAVMLTISLVCAGGLWLSRDFMASFFREPKLSGLIEIMTLTYLLMPFGLGALVVLEREFAFVQLQLMQAAATITGSVVSIVLAFKGFSFFSLAWGQLAQMAVLLILRTIARPTAVFCRPVFSGWRHIFHFGVFTTLTAVCNQVSGQLITGLIGRVLGLASLGLYERANGMNNYVANDLTFSIMQVVYVGFSRVKDKPAELARLYLTTVENLTGVLWPVYCLVALLAPQIVLVLYGPRWEAAAPILRIVALGSLLSALYAPQVRIQTSFCNVRTIWAVEVAGMIVRVAAAFLLARFGLAWTTAGVFASFVVPAVLYWKTFPALPLERNAIALAIARSAGVVCMTIAGPALLLVVPAVARMPAFLQLLLCLPVAGLGWLWATRSIRHSLRGEIALMAGHCGRLLKQLIGQPAGI
jgi:O-antigen/teichoic acid export membrane protein